MTLWIIEPRDPLIVRDGRPFGPNPGARAASLPFPLPATVVGGLRHKAGLGSDGTFAQTDANADAVKKLALRGPLLVHLNDQNDDITWLPPAPADALLLETETNDTASAHIQWLAPREEISAVISLPSNLLPVGPRTPRLVKPKEEAPHFWCWAALEQWLAAPTNDPMRLISELGIGKLATDQRMHVSVQPNTQTAIEGALFQTQGLVFTGNDWSRLALAADFDGATPEFNGGLAPLGGERRLMRWIPTTNTALPIVTPALHDQIIRERRARVVLLTPACFAAGFRPAFDWVRGHATAKLEAALVQRAQVISGWDMHALNANGRRGRPKKTRRLAPAGSVYFVTWDEGQDVNAWLHDTWMRNVSDDEQDCLDGFGLAVYGVWPNEQEELSQ